MMDLDEMRATWVEYDRKLDASLRLNREILRDIRNRKIRWPLWRFAFLTGLGALPSLACVVALGNFLYANIGAPRFVIPAVMLDAMAIAGLAVQIREVVMALQIQYNKPVAAIQRQIEELRLLRIRFVQGALAAGMLGWLPFIIVALKGFAGVDAYHVLDTGWMVGNAVFSVVIVGGAVWVARKYGERMGRLPFMQRLARDVAGYNLNAATRHIAEVADFERED